MEENKQIKIGLKTVIFILCVTIIVSVVYLIMNKFSKISEPDNNCINRNNIPYMMVDKPIIYLYPTKETEVSVKNY